MTPSQRSSQNTYRQIYIIKHTKSQNSNVSRLVLQLYLCNILVENEDVVGAAPTGDAPPTCEWSTILLPTKAPLILEVWRYIVHLKQCIFTPFCGLVLIILISHPRGLTTPLLHWHWGNHTVALLPISTFKNMKEYVLEIEISLNITDHYKAIQNPVIILLW